MRGKPSPEYIFLMMFDGGVLEVANKAKSIVITGSVAAGKSTLSHSLQAELETLGRDVRIIDWDEVGHQVMKSAEICQQLKETFGVSSRDELAEIVFADSELSDEKLARLNAIMHPAIVSAVVEEVKAIRAASLEAVIVHEIPLLPEVVSRLVQEPLLRFNLGLLVEIPEEIQLERLKTARALTDADAKRRVEAANNLKMSRAEALKMVADRVVRLGAEDGDFFGSEAQACVNSVL